MLNEIQVPVACPMCSDTARVLVGPREIPCPRCAGWDQETREAAMRAAVARLAVKPGISEADLTAEEFKEFRRLRVEHPQANRLTVLAWIEGRRFNPASDPATVREVERMLAAWRFKRCAFEGPLPAWAEAALRGEDAPMNDAEREWIEGLRAERRSSRRRAA